MTSIGVPASRAMMARIGLCLAAIAVWWTGHNVLVPGFQRAVGWERITDPTLQTLLGHWIAWQLPAVLPCLVLWAVGARFGLLPSIGGSLGSGGDWGRTVRSGLVATVPLVVVTAAIGAAVGGTFGWHPPWVKMVGDLVSNLYEELEFRGLLFTALYGVAAGSTFPLAGPVNRRAVLIATVGSCTLFALGHGQYPVPLRVVLGLLAVAFVWPWVRARSLWAPWLVHQLSDMILDSTLSL